MKIITLNTWGGRAGKEKLLNFFQNHKGDIDIFCLQEIWSAPYEYLEGTSAGGVKLSNEHIMVYGKQDISKILSEHVVFFHPHHREDFGLMMLVGNTLKVIESGEIFVHKYKGYEPIGDAGRIARNIQYVTIETEGGLKTIINFHGLWNGQGKNDSEDRLVQSDNILNFVQNLDHPFVLCGDFNLLPDTLSLKKFEEARLHNLIKEYGITSTRTSYYTKAEKFADYVFTSPKITIKDFKVLPDEISDHAPLYIDIE